MAVDDLAAEAAQRRLLARIGAGDHAAFEEFYRAYARRVAAFVRDVLPSIDLADEVVSDTMVAVWRSAGGFRGGSRVTTWVLAIAHHKALDALRRAGGAPVSLDALPSDGVADSNPVDTLLRIDDRFALDAALRALSAEHRTVLQLMYGFDRSHAEIATIVGCPTATVKTRVFYAKRNLRAHLERARAAEELA